MTQTTQHKMRAAAIDQFGGPITPHTLPVPQVRPDEILIRIESAGVGVWDPFEREGGFARLFGIEPKSPYVLGSDGAGHPISRPLVLVSFLCRRPRRAAGRAHRRPRSAPCRCNSC